MKSLTIPSIGNSDSFALFKFDKTVEERLRQELRDNEAELSQCAEGDVNEKSLSEKVITAKNILAQAEEDNKLLQQSSPTLWFLSPRSDPRSAGLLKPTSGGSCTRMSHRMNRNFLSIAHTFPEHGAMENILSGNNKSNRPLWIAPLPDLYEDPRVLTIESIDEVDNQLLKKLLRTFEAKWAFPMGHRLVRVLPGVFKEEAQSRIETMCDDHGVPIVASVRDDHGYQLWPREQPEDKSPEVPKLAPPNPTSKMTIVNYKNIPLQTPSALIQRIVSLRLD